MQKTIQSISTSQTVSCSKGVDTAKVKSLYEWIRSQTKLENAKRFLETFQFRFVLQMNTLAFITLHHLLMTITVILLQLV